jgi:hypothetical protein
VPRLAILLSEGIPTREHLLLGRILDFFGVSWQSVSELTDADGDVRDYVVFGSAQTVATALKQTRGAFRSVPQPVACYVYTSDDRDASERGLRSLCGNSNVSLHDSPGGNLSVYISRELAETAGPMAGLEVSLQLRKEDAIVAGMVVGDSEFATVVSAGDAPVFVRFQHCGIPVFFCASSYVVDIDQAVRPGFYDVKDHFCSVVPLIIFLRYMFPNVSWRPQELGACLIIDDPLLRSRYGSCDFGNLRDLMKRHDFTTNIGFIPWNWRRTSRAAGEFFRKESAYYSVSVHGCDHIGAEFGATSPATLDSKAKLAQSRMQGHEARTGIHHDPVMIFPQGVFSSVCPAVLKRNGFLAAVNTETVPVDSANARTRIRDVWDVAIMSYEGFPLFTRRYAFHGLENFAFDLLLGKPCLIVSHHEFFKDGGSDLIELIEKLKFLDCSLNWRPLGDVIRRACRRRVTGPVVEEVEMYGNELMIDNSSGQTIELLVRKREDQADLVFDILADGNPVAWTTKDNHVVFEAKISPRSEGHFRVAYREQAPTQKADRSLRFELLVAARRFLSEFRDDYLSRSHLLSAAAASLKNMVTKG